MKSAGIVRKLDCLGRVTLPVSLRHRLNIQIKDRVEILVDNDKIILRKYQDFCVFCDSPADAAAFQGKHVCRDCLATINQAVNRDLRN